MDKPSTDIPLNGSRGFDDLHRLEWVVRLCELMGMERVEQLAELEIAYPTYTAAVGIAARRIVSELGVYPLAEEWRTLKTPPITEWEHSHQSDGDLVTR